MAFRNATVGRLNVMQCSRKDSCLLLELFLRHKAYELGTLICGARPKTGIVYIYCLKAFEGSREGLSATSVGMSTMHNATLGKGNHTGPTHEL